MKKSPRLLQGIARFIDKRIVVPITKILVHTTGHFDKNGSLRVDDLAYEKENNG